MQAVLQKISCYAVAIDRIKFIAVSLLLSIFIRLLINNIIFLVFQQNDGLENPIVDNQSLFAKLFVSLALAPIIETFIFFFLPYKAVELLKEKWAFLPVAKFFIVVSSLLFACNHSFNITYFLASFFGGIVMSAFYLISIGRKENPYQNTAIFHALYNLFVISTKYF